MARQIKQRIRKLSILDASLEFGVDRHALTKELKRAYPSKQKFSIEEVFRALNSDSAKEKNRAAKARADMLTLEYEEAAGRLMDVGEFRNGLEDFVAVTNAEVSSLDTTDDLKRTLLRCLQSLKKNWDARIKGAGLRFSVALNGSNSAGA